MNIAKHPRILQRLQMLDIRARSLWEYPMLQWQRRCFAGEYGRIESKNPPLISVVIPTYNRGKLLEERTLPSVFAQDYPNFEVVIVGDGCPDDTPERMGRIKDPRLRFVNRRERGQYPKDPELRHLVAGIPPINQACEMAKGLWLASMDDDTVWEPNHLSALWNHACQNDAELVFSKTAYEISPGQWETKGELNAIPTSSYIRRSYLRVFAYRSSCRWVRLGGDRHMIRRMQACGVRMAMLDAVLTRAPLRPGTTKLWAGAEDREKD